MRGLPGGNEVAALEGLPEGEPLSPAPKQTAGGANDRQGSDLPAAGDMELDGWDDDVQGDWGM